jgi:hypothetical protein
LIFRSRPEVPSLDKVPEGHELVCKWLLCISFYDNRADVVAICAVVERSDGTSEPEIDLFGTAYQASSHFQVLTSIMEIGEQENYSILLGIRLRAVRIVSPAITSILFSLQGGNVEEESEESSLGDTLDPRAMVALG